jgi:hypothetical protein
LCRRRRFFAVFHIQYFLHPGRRSLAGANPDQAARDIAHHVIQKGIGRHIQRHLVTVARHRDRLDFPDGVRGLAVAGAEGTEIMLTEQVKGGNMHGVCIQGLADPAGSMMIERRANPAVQYPVPVTTGKGAEASVEVVIDRADPQNADAFGQVTVQAQHPGPFGTLGRGIEMCNLAQRMHAAVSTPAGRYSGVVVSHFSKCYFNHALDGRFLALDLPAQERTPVVFNTDCVSQELLR